MITASKLPKRYGFFDRESSRSPLFIEASVKSGEGDYCRHIPFAASDLSTERNPKINPFAGRFLPIFLGLNFYSFVKQTRERQQVAYALDLLGGNEDLLDRHTGETSRIRDKTDKAIIGLIFKFMRDRELWLRKDGEEEPQFFTVVERKRHYHLRHFAAHTSRKNQPHDQGLKGTLAPGATLDFHRPFGEATTETATIREAPAKPSYNEHDPKVRPLRALRALLEWSGCSGWPGFKSAREQELAILKAYEDCKLTGGISARGWVRFVKSRRDIAQMARKVQAASDEWPPNSRPFGMLVALADRIYPKSVRIVGTRSSFSVPLEIDISQPGRPTTPGPFLLFATIAEDIAKPGIYSLFRSCAQPILARNRWIPIESECEREVLRLALAFCENAERLGAALTLRKTFNNVPGLPDVFTDLSLTFAARGGVQLHVEVLGTPPPKIGEETKSLEAKAYWERKRHPGSQATVQSRYEDHGK